MPLLPLDLQTSEQVHQFLEKLKTLKVIKIDNKGQITTSPSDLAKHFIVAADGKTYLIEDVINVLPSEADSYPIKFVTKSGERKSLSDLKGECHDEKKAKDFLHNEKIANELVKIRVAADKAEVNRLSDFPDEIIEQIGGNLKSDHQPLGRLMQTSKVFNRIFKPDMDKKKKEHYENCENKLNELKSKLKNIIDGDDEIKRNMEFLLKMNPEWKPEDCFDHKKVSDFYKKRKRSWFAAIIASIAKDLVVLGLAAGLVYGLYLLSILVSLGPLIAGILLLGLPVVFGSYFLITAERTVHQRNAKWDAKRALDLLENNKVKTKDILELYQEIKKIEAILNEENKQKINVSKKQEEMKKPEFNKSDKKIQNDINTDDDISAPMLGGKKPGFFARIRAKIFGKKTTNSSDSIPLLPLKDSSNNATSSVGAIGKTLNAKSNDQPKLAVPQASLEAIKVALSLSGQQQQSVSHALPVTVSTSVQSKSKDDASLKSSVEFLQKVGLHAGSKIDNGQDLNTLPKAPTDEVDIYLASKPPSKNPLESQSPKAKRVCVNSRLS